MKVFATNFSKKAARIEFSKEAVKENLPTPFKALFDVAKKSEVPLVLVGGSARDAAISLIAGKDFVLPNFGDIDVVIPFPNNVSIEDREDELFYNDGYEKFEASLGNFCKKNSGKIPELASLGEKVGNSLLDNSEATYVDGAYAFQDQLDNTKNLEDRAAFSISHLGVERTVNAQGESVFSVFGDQQSLQDLKDRTLRIIGEADLSPAYLGKLIGRYVIYKEAGFVMEKSTQERIASTISNFNEKDYGQFKEMLEKNSYTYDGKQLKHGIDLVEQEIQLWVNEALDLTSSMEIDHVDLEL